MEKWRELSQSYHQILLLNKFSDEIMYLWTFAPSKDSDQTPNLSSLIRDFTVCPKMSKIIGYRLSPCQRFRSDGTDVWADLNLQWVDMKYGSLSYVTACNDFVWFGLNVAFNNLSVILRRCLNVAGSSMLAFRVLPHWNITPQTLWHDIPPSHIILTLSWLVPIPSSTFLILSAKRKSS